MENKRKIARKSPRNAFKRKNKVKEGRASKSRVKKKHESTKAWA